MNNLDKAAELILPYIGGCAECDRIGDACLDCIREATDAAKDIAAAGLLAPNLPERPDGGIWGDLGQFLVDTAENGGVAVAPPHPGVVTLDSKEARETALAVLAAAQYAEGSNE